MEFQMPETAAVRPFRKPVPTAPQSMLMSVVTRESNNCPSPAMKVGMPLTIPSPSPSTISTAQATMCITYSKVHTREYYINLAEQLIEAGAEEICLKDMAGVGRPAMLGDIVRAIKEKHPHIIIQYHGHSGPGFSVASMLEVAKAGGDVLDVAMEPLSWGKVHPDVITIQAMLRDAGFLVKDINMKAYMEARSLTQSFIDDFLGYWIDPKNALMTSLSSPNSARMNCSFNCSTRYNVYGRCSVRRA